MYKYKLSPGQMNPLGATGQHLDGEWMVWLGDDFNPKARLGRLTPQDPTPAEEYEYAKMTLEEIEIFNSKS